MQLEGSNFYNMQYKLVGNNYNEMHSILRQLLDFSTPERSNKGPKIKLKGGQNIESAILRKIMQLECSNFYNMQYKLVGKNYNEMHSILRQLFDSSTPERSNKGPKIKLKGGQEHKIDNIVKNNAVGVLKLLQYVI